MNFSQSLSATVFRVHLELFAYKRFRFAGNTIEDMLCFHILTVLYFEMATLPVLFGGSSFGYFSFKKSNTRLPRIPDKLQFIKKDGSTVFFYGQIYFLISVKRFLK